MTLFRQKCDCDRASGLVGDLQLLGFGSRYHSNSPIKPPSFGRICLELFGKHRGNPCQSKFGESIQVTNGTRM